MQGKEQEAFVRELRHGTLLLVGSWAASPPLPRRLRLAGLPVRAGASAQTPVGGEHRRPAARHGWIPADWPDRGLRQRQPPRRSAALALWRVIATLPLRWQAKGWVPVHAKKVAVPKHALRPLPEMDLGRVACHRATHRPQHREHTGHWRVGPCLEVAQEPGRTSCLPAMAPSVLVSLRSAD